MIIIVNNSMHLFYNSYAKRFFPLQMFDAERYGNFDQIYELLYCDNPKSLHFLFLRVKIYWNFLLKLSITVFYFLM